MRVNKLRKMFNVWVNYPFNTFLCKNTHLCIRYDNSLFQFTFLPKLEQLFIKWHNQGHHKCFYWEVGKARRRRRNLAIHQRALRKNSRRHSALCILEGFQQESDYNYNTEQWALKSERQDTLSVLGNPAVVLSRLLRCSNPAKNTQTQR